ncbi:DUF1080 domain-containing protein [Chitinophaga sedimenti]|uniref:3-keto-disaccharide hydrolase n=1 Tax=Chitinophaga sedimenti TaxID=2033606 RepID=UPI0020040D44|nr:DUF1080 domain-containing protein [Chitinophaga sedimenti]MCK7553785.1 DUF1080 domain-containing protein [Chitinophaga sedimenti]
MIEGEVTANGIAGTISRAGKSEKFTGVKAPLLKRTTAPVWGRSIELFNGKDLSGWKTSGAANQWEVRNGILTSPRSGANLITEQTFTDFKLHVEFKYEKGSNSGVYLRGRHEVQIEDSPADAHPASVLFSGVYGFLAPSEIAAKGPGVWQSYDITLIGRMVTIVVNGKTVISNQEIPVLQAVRWTATKGNLVRSTSRGDHGPIEFRKITITPAK